MPKQQNSNVKKQKRSIKKQKYDVKNQSPQKQTNKLSPIFKTKRQNLWNVVPTIIKNCGMKFPHPVAHKNTNSFVCCRQYSYQKAKTKQKT